MLTPLSTTLWALATVQVVQIFGNPLLGCVDLLSIDFNYFYIECGIIFTLNVVLKLLKQQ